SVAENVTTAYTATGSDPDAGDVLTYALVGGDDVDLFTIDAQTGVVSFKTPPNFERPGDADGNNTYTFAVTATDGALTSAPHVVTVTVTDVAEAPTISDAHVTVTGATGTGGAFRIGDTVTVTWDDTSNGDANEDQVTGVTVDFTAFGGGVVASSNAGGIWTAQFALVPGSL